MKNTLKTHWLGTLVLITAIVIGTQIYPDYGISYDEPSQRLIGQTTYDYATGHYKDFDKFAEKDHGTGFEWILMSLEKSLNITEYRDIYLMRHLVTHLFFLLCMFSGYVLVYRLFKSKWLATLAYIALVFQPRLFAHSFFNPKDIPATSVFLLTLLAAAYAFQKKKTLPFLILGLLIGYGACIRLTNLVILIPIALFFLIDLISTIRSKTETKHIFLNGSVLFASLCVSMYVTWPTLWGDPINNFIDMYRSNANFRWVDQMKFDGKLVLSTELPWYYIPKWFAISTPELWLLTGGVGILIFIIRFVKSPNKYLGNALERNILLSLICFVLPVVVIISLKSVLYDGWRHMYFIYPPFIILSMYGLNELLKRRFRLVVVGLCVLQLALIAGFMIKYHPFQQVYFNTYVSHDEDYLMEHYELDYWASCHYNALIWAAENIDEHPILINRNNASLIENMKFVPQKVRSRFTESRDLNEIKYYIQFYRTYPYTFPDNPEMPGGQIIHEKRVLGSPIYRIVKLR
ncbi:MAG: glycosyltransferase family 39 protein [Chitinophagales bacterium]|nr:glycosyltransferase family 39 protein [Chitinophagales bacterium]